MGVMKAHQSGNFGIDVDAHLEIIDGSTGEFGCVLLEPERSVDDDCIDRGGEFGDESSVCADHRWCGLARTHDGENARQRTHAKKPSVIAA